MAKSCLIYEWPLSLRKPITKIFVKISRLIGGLAGQNTASFESTTQPGFFCCLKEGRLRLEQGRLNDPDFIKRCSFKMWSNRFFDGYVSFESFDKSDQWLRQNSRRMEVSRIDSYKDNNDASFLLSETTEIVRPPTVATTTTTAATTTTTRRTTTTTPRTTTTVRTTTTTKKSFVEPCKYFLYFLFVCFVPFVPLSKASTLNHKRGINVTSFSSIPYYSNVKLISKIELE